MTPASARNALVLSCIGHFFAHLFEPVFFVAALVIPAQLGISYAEALTLIVAGKLLYGLGAPLAGWIADRWSTVGMMVVFFIGTGLSALLVGIAETPFQISLALAALGLFGSIYHPVGIAWMVRNAVKRGKAIGINGVFGGLGPAVGGGMAGILIESLGWRSAFYLPGLVVLGVGVWAWIMVLRGHVVEAKEDLKPEPPAPRKEAWRVGMILMVTMLCSGLIYQATQPALPKMFEERLGDLGSGVMGAGAAIMVVYLVAGLFQIVAGHLADRYSMKAVYIGMYLAQIPLLLLAAFSSGPALVAVAVAMVCGNMGGIPAENGLLARYAPAKWRGTAFGMKFILSFGVSGLGVPLVAFLHGQTGDFIWLFVLLAVMAAIVTVGGWLLPSADSIAAAPEPAARPAE